MDIQAFWIIALSVATPVAGVVGFALQLRQVKKVRLENEKLQLEIADRVKKARLESEKLELEIAALLEKASASDQRIIKPTMGEILAVIHQGKLGRALEARCHVLDYEVKVAEPSTYKTSLKETLIGAAMLSVAVLMVAYFVYDIYRLFLWLSSSF